MRLRELQREADSRPSSRVVESSPISRRLLREAIQRPLLDNRNNGIKDSKDRMTAGRLQRGRRHDDMEEIRLRTVAILPQQTQSEVQKSMSVSFLGTSSSVPTRERNVSCTVVSIQDGLYIVDCGEGSAVQLIRAQVDLRQVRAILITHLHGDHCFGLGSVLQAIDLAKSSEKGAEDHVTQIVGPTGTAELVRVSMGEDFTTRFRIIELVVGEDASRGPRPLTTPSSSFEWNTYHRPVTSSRQLNSCTVERRHAINIADNPDLFEAKQALSLDLNRSPKLWAPSHSHRFPSREESEENYSGRNYVAVEDKYWSLASGPSVRIRAAQLQHRVPCYGYVIEEMGEEGGTLKKVVILGDTIDSAPIAPLALDCDLISHEATFRKGMEERARVAQHSTGYLAGAFAHVVRAKHLVLTHFSARYRDVSPVMDRKTGRARKAIEPSEEEDQAQLASAIKSLIHEARSHYQGHIVAARDFFSIDV